MKLLLSAVVSLSLSATIVSASAFTPVRRHPSTSTSTTTGGGTLTSSSQPPGWNLEASASDMFLDDEFDGVPLVRIMGLKRLRRMTRRQRRASNAASAGGVVSKELRSSASSSSESENTTKCSSDDETLKIIIAGAPASGKGTQCEAIRSKYGVVHLSTGDMLRAAVSEGTDVGRAAKDYMDAGKLVPDEVIIGVVSVTV